MSRELRSRRRSLLAWIMVVSLLLGLVVVRQTEAQAAEVEGVSLTVEYLAEGTVVKTETYPRYYTDETNTEMEESVDFTLAEETVIEGLEDAVFAAWQVNNPSGAATLHQPGAGITYLWSELLGDAGETTAKITVEALIQTYETDNSFVSEDGNTYYISNFDELGGITLNHLGNSYSVNAPAIAPMMMGHEFLRWELYVGEIFSGMSETAGGVFTSSTGICEFTYSEQTPFLLKSVWTPKATINFYEDFTYYYDGLATSTAEIIKQDGVPFELTTPPVPAYPPLEFENGTFLAWNSYIDNTYIGADETVKYETWPTLSSGYIGTVIGTWLNASYEFGNESVTDWQGAPSVEAISDSLFTVSAPAGTPKSNDIHKYFKGWSVLANDVELTATAGGKLSTEDGIPYEFSYEIFADSTLDFTAEWEDLLSTTVTYNLAGGELNGSTNSVVYEQVQSTPEDESFAVTTLSEPTRAGYSFVAWEYTDEAGTVHRLNANQLTESVLPYFSYEAQPTVTFTAVWQQTATINYVPNPTMIPVQTETMDKAEGETSLTITLPLGWIVEDEQGGEFLAWSGDGFTPYYALPGSVVTVPWDTVLQYNGVINVMAHWLRHDISLGDVEVNDYKDTSYAIAREDGFIVYAPEEPVAVVKEDKYIFLNWLAEFPNGQNAYTVNPGELIATLDEDGETMVAVVFDYENYADSTISFTAQWQKALEARFIFDCAGGTIKGEPTLTTVGFQDEITDTLFTVLMPAAPSYERHIFKGWKYTAEDGTEYVFNVGEDTESQNLFFTYGEDTEITFTALWAEIPAEATFTLYHDENRIDYTTEKKEILVGADGTPYTETKLDAGLQKEDKTQLFVGWYHEEKGYVGLNGTVSFVWDEEIYETEFVGQWATMQYDFGGVDVKEELETPLVIVSSKETADMVKIIMPITVPGTIETETMTYTFDGWRVEVLGESYEEGGTEACIGDFLVEDLKGTTITATALWAKTLKEITVSEGTAELTVGQRYVFSEGSWKLEGDSSVYTGGMAFYVPATGTYSILKGE